MSDQGRKNLGNAIWNILDVAIYPVFQLVFTPYFIDQLGAELYGLWTLITSIMVSLQLFNLGLGMGTFRNLAFHWNRDDKARARHTLNVNLSMTSLLIVPILLTTLIIGFAIREWNLFNLEAQVQGYAALCVLLTSFVVLFRLGDQVFQAGYKAIERFDRAAIWNTSIRMGIFFSYLIILWIDPDIRWMLILNISISALFALIQFIQSKHLLGAFPRFEWDLPIMKKELKFSKWLWLQSLAVILAFQFADRYVVVQFYGLEVLGFYGIMAVLINHIHMGLTATVTWVFPKFTEVEKDREAFYRTVRNALLSFSLIALMAFFWISPWFFEFWLGTEKSAAVRPYIAPFIAFEMIFIFTITPYFYLNGIEKPRMATKLFLVTTSFHILGMLLGYTFISGAAGIIYGMVFASIPSMLINNWIIQQRYLRKSTWYETAAIAIPQLVGVMTVLLSDENIILIGAGGAIMFLTIWLIYLRPVHIDLKLLRT